MFAALLTFAALIGWTALCVGVIVFMARDGRLRDLTKEDARGR